MSAKSSLSRRERRRQRRRQRLIDAARTVIAEKGVKALTINDVTEAADVAVGSFYTYFKDKEELLEAAIWEDLQRLAVPRDEQFLSRPPLERATIMLHEAYAFVEEHRPLMRAVFGAGHTAEHFQRGLELIRERVRYGLENEPMIPKEDVPWLTALASGMIAGGILFLLNHPEVSAEEMTRHTLRFLSPLGVIFQQESGEKKGTDRRQGLKEA